MCQDNPFNICSKEVSNDTTDHKEHPLSQNSHIHQNTFDAQTPEIATMMRELNCALDENHKLKDMFNPAQLVEAMSKAVNNMTVKESPKTSQVTQYKGNSNYVGWPRQPQLACGANGMLKPNVYCLYGKDKGTPKIIVSTLIR